MNPTTRTHGAVTESAGDGTVTFSGVDGSTTRADVPGFELLDLVGQGGMGVVWRARDRSLQRDVAVKILSDRYAPGSAAAERFLNEARITGQLQHPGIPAVHQVGVLADGRPFLAMKLIKGRSLAELLSEKQPINLLAVFEQIAQAVGYAHAHGVIHRDLKPANVMVGAFGEVQVMDWGLAKVLGRRESRETTAAEITTIRTQRDVDLATSAGSILGTPAFMPPEQAIGAVDQLSARSDVFGLGSILCVMLTGRPPFVGKDGESTRQLAAKAKLDDAFAALDACAGEPELVVLCKRCLGAEPVDRPANGAAVAETVGQLRAVAEERARQAEVERARAEIAAAEQRKRRQVQLAFGSAVIAALLAGGALTGWQWWRATQHERATQTALGNLNIEQEKTKQALDQVTKERARLLRERANTNEALLGMTDDTILELFVKQPVLTDQEKDFLRRAIRLYENITASADAGVDERNLRAVGYLRVGTFQRRLEDMTAAEENLIKGRTLFLELHAENPRSVNVRSNLAQIHDQLIQIYDESNRASLALQSCRDALTLRQQLAEEYPNEPKRRHLVARSRELLGHTYFTARQFDQAHKEYLAHRAILQQLVADFPKVEEYVSALAGSYYSRALALQTAREFGAAVEEYKLAREKYLQIVKEWPETANHQFLLARTQTNLGILYEVGKERPLAEAEYVAARDRFRNLCVKYPSQPGYRSDFARVQNNLAQIHLRQNQPAAAEACYKEALEQCEHLSRHHAMSLADRKSHLKFLSNYINFCLGQRRHADSERLTLTKIQVLEKLRTDMPEAADYSNQIAGELVNVAIDCEMQQKYAEAHQYLERALPYHRESLKSEPKNVTYRQFYSNNRFAYIRILHRRGEYSRSPALIQEMLEYSRHGVEDYFRVANHNCSAMGLIEKDSSLDSNRRGELLKQCGDEAMRALQRATELGFRDAAKAKSDASLKPIRDRGDFQVWLTGLSKAREVAPLPRLSK